MMCSSRCSLIPGEELLTSLAGTNIDELTPMQAFELLRQWKAKYAK